MSAACDRAAEGLGNGVAAALQAVDCVANETIGAAFGRLFAPGGAMVSVLTILLTIVIAWFGINLMLGRASLSVRSVTPRMMTIGLVLTLVTSWFAYSTLVWNLAVGGPDQIATIITGSQGSATQVFAQKIDVVFEALRQASPDQAQGQAQGQAPGQAKDISAFSPEGMMWLGAMLFMLGTVGVLVTARIALAVLVAIGPVFVVMALFDGTRGLFVGWLKGLVMLAITPLLAVLGGSVMLELAVPVLAALVQNPGQIDPQAAMAFFMIGAVHVALMVLVIKVAGTMVSGWRVFGMAPDKADRFASAGAVAPLAPAIPAAAAGGAVAGAASAGAVDRRIPVSAFATAPAANDAVAAAGGMRETRVINHAAIASASGQPSAGTPGTGARARGIGSRFRAPPPRLNSEKTT